ncbi:SsrA-binding protein [Candidatus Nomurabacteria bacterium RIFCSPHIGHO2_01_FULL_39_9]|uniref:SsrA-binding protein n=1 Tax=Candidatus Nomurabacteria bacterium RIFCSPHIGHO2_01_FULL_39_9 TaxID=1801735 RepID=A0A1F6UWN8_9BACT|nr:MAG: SsrA-binding protein [Candidatus Nomurabacteria bacterium RIFCSPHIGHO2_01_FULL_39_9]
MNLIENKKAYFDYEVLEPFEAGLKLLGFEVKSIKNHRGSLEGARVIIRGSEAYLVGASIPPYQAKNTPAGYDETRIRKLLVTKQELKSLIGKEKTKGLTLVPISMYTKGRNIKLRFAIVRGKKKYDKRKTIKERETKRTIARTLKRG